VLQYFQEKANSILNGNHPICWLYERVSLWHYAITALPKHLTNIIQNKNTEEFLENHGDKLFAITSLFYILRAINFAYKANACRKKDQELYKDLMALSSSDFNNKNDNNVVVQLTKAQTLEEKCAIIEQFYKNTNKTELKNLIVDLQEQRIQRRSTWSNLAGPILLYAVSLPNFFKKSLEKGTLPLLSRWFKIKPSDVLKWKISAICLPLIFIRYAIHLYVVLIEELASIYVYGQGKKGNELYKNRTLPQGFIQSTYYFIWYLFAAGYYGDITDAINPLLVGIAPFIPSTAFALYVAAFICAIFWAISVYHKKAYNHELSTEKLISTVVTGLIFTGISILTGSSIGVVAVTAAPALFIALFGMIYYCGKSLLCNENICCAPKVSPSNSRLQESATSELRKEKEKQQQEHIDGSHLPLQQQH
jgi:hypothetical protein